MCSRRRRRDKSRLARERWRHSGHVFSFLSSWEAALARGFCCCCCPGGLGWRRWLVGLLFLRPSSWGGLWACFGCLNFCRCLLCPLLQLRPFLHHRPLLQSPTHLQSRSRPHRLLPPHRLLLHGFRDARLRCLNGSSDRASHSADTS